MLHLKFRIKRGSLHFHSVGVEFLQILFYMFNRSKEGERPRTEREDQVFREYLEGRLPQGNRKYWLLYLLHLADGQLTKQQLDAIGKRIAQPINETSTQSAQVQTAHSPLYLPPVSMADLLSSIGYKYDRYPHLKDVAIQYSRDEVEDLTGQEFYPQAGYTVRSVDVWSGHGPSRKLLKEFYSLDGVSEVQIENGHKLPNDNLLIYEIPSGRQMATVMNDSYQREQREMRGYVHVAQKYSAHIFPREQIFPQ